MFMQAFEAFGWRLDRTSLRQGSQYKIRIPRITDPKDMLATTLHTKGLITGVSDNPEHTPVDRGPGFFSPETPTNLPPCVATFTAQEDAEYWCLHKGLNNRQSPGLTKLVLPAGQERALPVGTLLFVCRGEAGIGSVSIDKPTPVKVASQPVQLRAVTDVYGLFFDSEKT